MSKIVIHDTAGRGELLESSHFAYEEELKRYLIEHPSLLQLESVTDEPIEHITVGEEWYAGPGRVDIVQLGSDAVLTVIETKLRRNPEARRQVVAQVLEYGAYLSEWTASQLQQEIEKFLRSKNCPRSLQGKTFDGAIQHLLADENTSQDPREFLAQVEQNLRAGRIRLIVAVDEVGEEAQKIVTFINSFSTFDVYLLQISEFRDGDKTILVPQLLGYARKVPSSRDPRTAWTWEKLAGNWNQDLVDIAKHLSNRLRSALPDLSPDVRLYKNGVNVIVKDGWKLFGVEFSEKHGAELWFWTSDDLDLQLPASVVRRRTPKYLYLSGEFDSLTDEALRMVCNESMRQWEERPD